MTEQHNVAQKEKKEYFMHNGLFFLETAIPQKTFINFNYHRRQLMDCDVKGKLEVSTMMAYNGYSVISGLVTY